MTSAPSPQLAPRIAALYAALETSDHVRYIQRCNALFTQPFYPLSTSEIEQLVRYGNTADDWLRVRKTRPDALLDAARIRDCDFQGFVVLGQFNRDVEQPNTSNGVRFRSGCYRSTLRNTVVLDNALIRDTHAVCDVVVDSFSSIIACGSVSGGKGPNSSSFSNGMPLHVGVEHGGRDVRVYAELPFDVAALIATKRDDTLLQQQYDAFVDAYVAATQSTCSIIARHARVTHCANVEAVFIGCYGVVNDAEVRHSTLLSSQLEPSRITSKSIVQNAIIQWNSSIESLAFVDRALLCDTSHVERHGVVLSSILGANTRVAEGEITSSLVGPFVGFHHQALLIATVWPQGKGNVGYGANVGSNHTLKAPDQELWAGEGVFFGLGCCIKFPSNFQRAPYAVVATGVNTLPQCVEMPFALINSPGHNIPALSPAINEISPAWVLQHSVFTVLRNESKFATRNKSLRTTIDAAIFRPEIVQYMIDARSSLVAAAGKAQIQLLDSNEAIYTDKQVKGLGKNYMRETSRLEAIAAYSFFIQVYALEDGLLKWLEEGNQGLPVETIGDLPRSSFALETLAHEFPLDLRITDALKDLVVRRHRVVQDAIKGKRRDDARGTRIIADYTLVHAPVEQEHAVQYAKRLAADTQRRVARFVAKL